MDGTGLVQFPSPSHAPKPASDPSPKAFSNPSGSVAPRFPDGYILNGSWILKRRIGQGRYSDVYAAVSNDEGCGGRRRVAIKVEKEDIPSEGRLLKWEATVLSDIQDCPFVCRMHECGILDDGGFYIVMDLCSETLSECRKRQPGGQFRPHKGAAAAMSMLNCIEALHKSGFVHRDIKPSNFVRPLRDSKNAPKSIMIDFGLARRHHENGVVLAARPMAEFRGTSKYASLNSHLCKELGPRDDLFSFLFVLVDFVLGKLPWSGFSSRNDIASLKRKLFGRDFVKNDSIPEPIYQIAQHLNTLRFQDNPDYNLVRGSVQELCSRRPSLSLTPARPHSPIRIIPEISEESSPMKRLIRPFCESCLVQRLCEDLDCHLLHPPCRRAFVLSDAQPLPLCLEFIRGICRKTECQRHHWTETEEAVYLRTGCLPVRLSSGAPLPVLSLPTSSSIIDASTTAPLPLTPSPLSASHPEPAALPLLDPPQDSSPQDEERSNERDISGRHNVGEVVRDSTPPAEAAATEEAAESPALPKVEEQVGADLNAMSSNVTNPLEPSAELSSRSSNRADLSPEGSASGSIEQVSTVVASQPVSSSHEAGSNVDCKTAKKTAKNAAAGKWSNTALSYAFQLPLNLDGIQGFENVLLANKEFSSLMAVDDAFVSFEHVLWSAGILQDEHLSIHRRVGRSISSFAGTNTRSRRSAVRPTRPLSTASLRSITFSDAESDDSGAVTPHSRRGFVARSRTGKSADRPIRRLSAALHLAATFSDSDNDELDALAPPSKRQSIVEKPIIVRLKLARQYRSERHYSLGSQTQGSAEIDRKQPASDVSAFSRPPSPAHSLERDHLESEPGELLEPDHQESVLHGLERERPILPKADLQECMLIEPELEEPALQGSELKVSLSPESDLQEPILLESELPETMVLETELQGRTLPGSELQEVALPVSEESFLPESELQEPVLPQSELQESVLPESEFQERLLPESEPQEPALPESEPLEPVLPESEPQEPVLLETELQQPVLPESEFQEPVLPESELLEPVLPESEPQEPVLPESEFQQPVLPQSELQEPVLPQSELQEPVLAQSELQEPVLPQSELQEPVLAQSELQEPVLPQSEFQEPVLPQSEPQEPILLESELQEPVLPESELQELVLPDSVFQEPALPESELQQPVRLESEFQEPVLLLSNPEEVQLLESTPQQAVLPECRPQVPVLHGSELSEPIQERLLQGSELSEPFFEPTLPKSELSGALLPKSELEETVLVEPESQRPALPNAELQMPVLQESELSEPPPPESDLLEHMVLEIDLQEPNQQRPKLKGPVHPKSEREERILEALPNPDLEPAGSRLSQAKLPRIAVPGPELSHALCPESTHPESELPQSESDFAQAELPQTELLEAEVQQSGFQEVELLEPDVDHPDSQPPQAKLPNPAPQRVVMSESDLPEFDFTDFELAEPNLPGLAPAPAPGFSSYCNPRITIRIKRTRRKVHEVQDTLVVLRLKRSLLRLPFKQTLCQEGGDGVRFMPPLPVLDFAPFLFDYLRQTKDLTPGLVIPDPAAFDREEPYGESTQSPFASPSKVSRDSEVSEAFSAAKSVDSRHSDSSSNDADRSEGQPRQQSCDGHISDGILVRTETAASPLNGVLDVPILIRIKRNLLRDSSIQRKRPRVS